MVFIIVESHALPKLFIDLRAQYLLQLRVSSLMCLCFSVWVVIIRQVNLQIIYFHLIVPIFHGNLSKLQFIETKLSFNLTLVIEVSSKLCLVIIFFFLFLATNLPVYISSQLPWKQTQRHTFTGWGELCVVSSSNNILLFLKTSNKTIDSSCPPN